jgi:hypothetical protein
MLSPESENGDCRPPQAVIPAQAGIHFAFSVKNRIKMDYTPLLRRALRAIRFANVRFGILPAQSRFRGNDDNKRGRHCLSGRVFY